MSVDSTPRREADRSPEPRGQVLLFRPRAGASHSPRVSFQSRAERVHGGWSEPWDDYHGDDGEEHPRRTLMNIMGFAFTLLLIGAGLWLAHTLSEMRQIQDCVLSGRTNCAPIEIQSLRP